MRAGKLKRILEKALEQLQNVDDDAEIAVKTNTYFIKGRTFLGLSEGYVDLDNIDIVENVIELTDVDLCIALDHEENKEHLMTICELQDTCERHHVKATLEKEFGESGWPTFKLKGRESDVGDLLDELGFDEETIDEMIEGE